MTVDRSRVLLGTALVSGLLAALSMVVPWARSGRVDRSMFQLISAASALDLLTGVEKLLVLAAAMAVTTSVAVALIAVAWSRFHLAAIALLVPGPIMLVAVVVVARTPLTLGWGAIAGSVAAVFGSLSAILVLLNGARPPDHRT